MTPEEDTCKETCKDDAKPPRQPMCPRCGTVLRAYPMFEAFETYQCENGHFYTKKEIIERRL